ncbi:MAG: hypothetical protein RBR52_11645 [Thiomonas sp.]|uniref:hypothetical protein n=1 Tax=Thiomonas sp. TaxID=2047785 RepID=UPI002A361E72|nr:hypothetical protein [Thiomonas sp.]MDY0331131.1 hypothetical protein [Thiomonas sp.]
MNGGLIALALASVTGLLAAFLWLSQTQTVNNTADLQRAEQRCQQARFDQRFDSTLSTPNPAAAASAAARVRRICGEAHDLRQQQRAQAASQAAQMQRLQKSLSNTFTPAASQPKKEQPK